jgi:hypothetical protein
MAYPTRVVLGSHKHDVHKICKFRNQWPQRKTNIVYEIAVQIFQHGHAFAVYCEYERLERYVGIYGKVKWQILLRNKSSELYFLLYYS